MTDESLSARIAGLSPEARAALRQRLAGRSSATTQTVSRRGPAEPVPMSFAQWRLWFLEQFRPGTNAWNTPVAVSLRGPLSVGALRSALQLLVQRHATLRTTFSAPGGRPVPEVHEGTEIELPVLELGDFAGAGPEEAIEAFIHEVVSQPFKLESDLMLRCRALRVAPEHHVLVLVAHHIACDGWSKGLLLEELSAAYAALVKGESPSLPDLPIEYADFAIWQRQALSGDALERLTAHWTERLAGAPPALELPTDKPRPTPQRFQGAVEWLTVAPALSEAVVKLGRQERATPFMTLMAAFVALLHAHTGQEDVLVGSPAAMRTLPELERLVGLFANTLVYRVSLAGSPSFRDLVQRVRQTAIEVYAHQDLPFEKIVEAVRPPRDPSRNPLVQVNMRVEGREPELSLAGLSSEPIPLDPGIARFDLAIELAVTDDGFDGYLEYDSALFNQASAAAFAEDFVAILEACVGHPDDPLRSLGPVQAVSRRERARVPA